jgi:hypothetical protein
VAFALSWFAFIWLATFSMSPMATAAADSSVPPMPVAPSTISEK